MKALSLLVLFTVLFACGGGEPVEPAETVGQEIADGYNAALDKAREVEQLAIEQKERLDAALDAANGDAKKDP